MALNELVTIDEAYRAEVVRRLQIAEGQVRGVQGMVEEGRYCIDILTQLAAVQEALRAVGKTVLRRYLETCATQAIRSGDAEEVYDELTDVFFKYAR